MKNAFKLLSKLIALCAGIYGLLFLVFYLDLDGKLLFRKVEPMLVKHYDKMERRDPLSMAYDVNG